jgi:prevent-host-death family protein
MPRDAKNPDDFAFGQIALYNSSMPRKEINFSQAREQFRALVEDVKRSGRPVTILRRGKPEAVLISYDQFQEKFSKKKKSPLAPRRHPASPSARRHRRGNPRGPEIRPGLFAGADTKLHSRPE